MFEKMKEDFLKEMSVTAQEMYLASFAEIEDNFIQEIPSIADSLLASILCGLEQFEKRKDEKLVSELKYVYISFLRTSVVSDNENYRLDFYDEKGRVSLVECSTKWNFDYIFNYYQEIKITLEEKFKHQTKVMAYELDDILYNIADLYRKKAREKIPFVLDFVLQENGSQILGDKSVKFYQGEFLDKIIFLLQWENGMIHTNEKQK